MPDDLLSPNEEIARLRGELAACRFCLSLALNMLSQGDPRIRSAIRDKIGLASVRTDDNGIREGFDRFKQRLLEALPSDET